MLNPRLDRVTPSRGAIAMTVAMLLASIALPAAALRGAQGGPMPLRGSVYDPTGAVLPGVDLTLESATEESNGRRRPTRAGASNSHQSRPGRYVLEAAVPGFSKLRNDLNMKDAKDWERAIALGVGQVAGEINVSERRVPSPTPSRVQSSAPARIGGNIHAAAQAARRAPGVSAEDARRGAGGRGSPRSPNRTRGLHPVAASPDGAGSSRLRACGHGSRASVALRADAAAERSGGRGRDDGDREVPTLRLAPRSFDHRPRGPKVTTELTGGRGFSRANDNRALTTLRRDAALGALEGQDGVRQFRAGAAPRQCSAHRGSPYELPDRAHVLVDCRPRRFP